MRSVTLSALVALFIIGCTEPTAQTSNNSIRIPAATSDGIAVGSLSDAGMDTAEINKLQHEITEGVYPNIHSLLIMRNNKLVYENYWTGKDNAWGNDQGVRPHTIDSLHDLRSISKSVVGICVGIAIAQGKIKSVDQRVFEFFPEYAKYDTGLIRTLTIKHLLTMSSGLEWNEEVPYDNPINSEIQMIRSPQPIEYVLSRPMDTVPGAVWKYNGGTTQLLAAIIKKTTGKQVDSFANEFIFQPLGMKPFYWFSYEGTHIPAAASGLRLRPRDILKFGMLCYNKGQWEGRQIVPASWIAESFQPQIKIDNGAYGYQFWILDDSVNNKPVRIVGCIGNGDQRIFFDHENNLLVVVTAGNYNQWNIRKNSHAMMRERIYPSLTRK